MSDLIADMMDAVKHLKPGPVRLFVNPRYWAEVEPLLLRGQDRSPGFSGLPVVLSPVPATWVVEYSDGSFELPSGERTRPPEAS